MRKSKAKKAVKISVIVLSSLIAALILAVACIAVYATAPFTDFYKRSDRAFVIPGLGDGFVPQGLTYDAKRSVFYVSGYDVGSKPSSIYAVCGDSVKHILIRDEDGDFFHGHSGGITYHGDYMYLAGSSKGCLFVLRYRDLLEAKDGDSVQIIGKFDTFLRENDHIRVSFTGGSDECIYVGEYFAEAGYPTPMSHRFSCDGEEFGGLVLEYRYDPDAPYGIAPQATRAISVVDEVQGMCFDQKGDLYLSCSGAYKHSRVYRYQTSSLKRMDDLSVFDERIPHYATHSSSLNQTIEVPPMSEEIVVVNNKLYIVNEFASNSALIGKLTAAKYCYALDLTFYQ